MTRDQRDTVGAGGSPGRGTDAGERATAVAAVGRALADGGVDAELLREAVEGVGVGVGVYDASGAFVYVNRAYADLVGVDRGDLSTSHVWDVNPLVRVNEFDGYWESFDVGETRRRETVHRRGDGDEVPVETHTTAIEVDGTVYHVGTIADLSERIEGWEEIERQNERIERFASVVSHDLRNPLNVAMGRIRLVEEESDSDQIEPVKRALERMEELIDDVLTLARDGNRVTEPERVDLAAVVRAAWSTAGNPGATLAVDDDVGTIMSDRSRLTTLFENLFDNAVSHAGPGVAVRVGRTDDGEGFYVADDGPGIPPEDREEVFDYGYTTESAGTGFGLTIVEEIADAHGWRVSLTGSEAGGARFEFRGVRSA